MIKGQVGRLFDGNAFEDIQRFFLRNGEFTLFTYRHNLNKMEVFKFHRKGVSIWRRKEVFELLRPKPKS